MDQLTAMKWVREIWDDLDQSIMYNCWHATEELDRGNECASNISTFWDTTAVNERNDVVDLLDEVVPPRHATSVEQILNPAGEYDCTTQCTEST